MERPGPWVVKSPSGHSASRVMWAAVEAPQRKGATRCHSPARRDLLTSTGVQPSPGQEMLCGGPWPGLTVTVVINKGQWRAAEEMRQ